MNNTSRRLNSDCIFCNKGKSGIAFFESENFRAIYNISPILPGHSLIIPKKHVQSIFELSDSELSEMMLVARTVTTGLKTYFNCDGSDWTIQDGESAGQTVGHLHMHIIPRFPNDLPLGTEWYDYIKDNEKIIKESKSRKKLDSIEYKAITKKLSVVFKSKSRI